MKGQRNGSRLCKCRNERINHKLVDDYLRRLLFVKEDWQRKERRSFFLRNGKRGRKSRNIAKTMSLVESGFNYCYIKYVTSEKTMGISIEQI